jgi:hypothetical protein
MATKMTMKQIYAVRARQAAEKAEKEAKAKAARRSIFISRARKLKAAAQTAA